MIDTSERALEQALNPAQREAVQHVHGPLLVLAGAGSGKTRVLTMRIAALIDRHGVPPERIFAVTFTNKAAGEMKHRIGQLLNRDPSGLWIGTFHSLSARLLRREAELLGFSRQFTIYDEDDQLSLIRRIMDQQGHSVKDFPPRAVQTLISAAKNRMEPPSKLASGAVAGVARVASEVYSALGPALKAANAMDFDDLLLHPLTLFREHPDRLSAYQNRFSFILVDEFQDTNRAQYDLIRQLGAHGNVAAVGDDDQSIYGWRGADVRNMQEFLKDFHGVRLVRLEENYRSTQVVLDAANGVIAENSGRIGKTLVTRRRGGEFVTLVTAADERDEAEWVVRELQKRSAAADWQYREMAVLYRTNSQSRALEVAFHKAGVPYRLVGSISFYDRREVKDLLAYLRLVSNPADDEAFLRAVGVPRRGLGETSLETLGRTARQWGKPLLETARIADRVPDLRPNVREAFCKFADLVDRAVQKRELPPLALLEHIIETIDYKAVLAAEGHDGEDRWENVRELVASAANWSEVLAVDAESGETPLERFLAEAALLSAVDKEEGEEQGVTLMTLHTAKGLEWPLVVLTGLEDGLFPSFRATEQPNGVEEERRLCYVGFTRAKDKLYLTHRRRRRVGDRFTDCAPSRFLRAIPPGIIEEQTTSPWVSGWGGTRERWNAGTRFHRSLVPPEEISQDSPRYVKGERILHHRFGSGTILGLLGAGRDLKVLVAFDDEEVGVKQLLVASAGLQREWDGA